jgi:3-hydroxyacyl-CoA dehydrogenase, C-terminal domain
MEQGTVASQERRARLYYEPDFLRMYREAFHLGESGVATVEDVDRSQRNDVGYWIIFAGPFRYMDLMGVPAYKTEMIDLLSDPDCGKMFRRL